MGPFRGFHVSFQQGTFSTTHLKTPAIGISKATLTNRQNQYWYGCREMKESHGSFPRWGAQIYYNPYVRNPERVPLILGYPSTRGLKVLQTEQNGTRRLLSNAVASGKFEERIPVVVWGLGFRI